MLGIVALAVGLTGAPAQAGWWNPKPTFTIQASADIGGTINPSGAITVKQGSNIWFAITADPSHHISYLDVDGQTLAPDTRYTFSNVNASHYIHAAFALNSSFTLTSSAGRDGTISPNGALTVAAWSATTYTITPALHFHVSDVTVDSRSVGSPTSYTFSSVIADHSIRALFAIDQFPISASAGPNGTISPSGDVQVTYGTAQSYRITPATGFHINQVLVDSQPIGPQPRYTFSNVTAPHTITATFGSNYRSFDVKGATATSITGLNTAGLKAGYFTDANGTHGFLDPSSDLSGTAATTVDAPSATDTRLTGVNDSGTATGCYRDADGLLHGFVRTAAGVLTVLDHPDTSEGPVWDDVYFTNNYPYSGVPYIGGTCATGINAAGVVVGFYTTHVDETVAATHGFRWDGTFTTVDDAEPGTVTPDTPLEAKPPYVGTWLLGINTTGVVLGTADYVDVADSTLGTALGIVITGETLRTLEDPTSSHSWCRYTLPTGINDADTIVGNMGNGCGGEQHAWQLPAGAAMTNTIAISFVDANAIATRTIVAAINNSGLVGGTWTDAHGRDHGFVGSVS